MMFVFNPISKKIGRKGEIYRRSNSYLPAGSRSRYDLSKASYHLWSSKFGGIILFEAKRLSQLKTGNGRLKLFLTDAILENELSKKP
ncbi:hypothetical protein MCEMSHM24_03096 [Comamonadaceae bacterium]|jgi:hypothetical protein